MGRKRTSSHPFGSGVKVGSQEAVADLLEAVSSFVTDLTECPSDRKTRKIQKIIKIINQPVPSSEEQYVSANNISDNSAMESEENENADEDDYNRRHKHQRHELSGLPMPNENRTPTEEPSTEQPTKKWVRPFDHSSKFDKRRFRSNNPFHSRGAVGPSMMKTCFPRQRCPDFEDMGYCLRGDMCLMEHGANCIMVEDIQSLLRLKLTGVQPGTVPKPVTLKDPLRLNGALSSAVTAIDADAYDPDQPLWVNGQSVASPNDTSAGTATAPDADLFDPDEPLWANGQSAASPNYTCAGTATTPGAYDPDQPLWANWQSVNSPNYTSAGTATAPDAYDPDQPLWANRQSVNSPNYTSAGIATVPDADLYDPDQSLLANGQPMASPNRTSAGTATGASTNNPSHHPDPGPSVWGRIGN